MNYESSFLSLSLARLKLHTHVDIGKFHHAIMFCEQIQYFVSIVPKSFEA